jgi:uncharacterized protein (TIGR00369 family)
MADASGYGGNPFLALLGTELEEWSDGHVRVGLELRPELLNRSGVVHGGVLATLLDHAGGLSGLHCTVTGNRRYGMTISLTTHFLRQSRAGRLTAIGHRISSGRKIFYARSEVMTEAGEVLAAGSSVHRYRSGSETPEGTPHHPMRGVE